MFVIVGGTVWLESSSGDPYISRPIFNFVFGESVPDHLTIIPSFIISQLPRNINGTPSDITLTTQCSIDRLSRLEVLAQSWNGILSAAVFIPNGTYESISAGQANIRALHRKIEDLKSCRLDISVVIGGSMSRYPINVLRNLALEQCQTSLVFILDADFTVSKGLHEFIQTQTCLTAKTEKYIGFVVPALEMVCENVKKVKRKGGYGMTDLPTTKTEVVDAMNKGLARTFYGKATPADQAATNIPKWLAGDCSYPITSAQGFEPYVIVSRELIPKFDERFYSYGWNKVQWLRHLDHLGFQLEVLPNHFVIHPCREEEPTSSAETSSRQWWQEVRRYFLVKIFLREMSVIHPKTITPPHCEICA